MIVSRGIGASTLPFRTFSSPEVVVCNIGNLEEGTQGPRVE
jgi:predicted MPP superfamily phosphohydrolase